MKQEFSFGVVLYRMEASRPLYLLICHTNGHWGFPKGHAEPGEMPEATARRECAEETGVTDVVVDPDARFIERYQRGSAEKTVTYFLARTEQRALALQTLEIRDAAWLPYRDARARLTYPEARAVLDEAHGELQP